MSFPALPSRAAYITLDNASRRNTLSIEVLNSLREQLRAYNTPPGDSRPLLLPNFDSGLLRGALKIEQKQGSLLSKPRYEWLRDTDEWHRRRRTLPKVLVLRSKGPVFCAGHDLEELRYLKPPDVHETFRLSAEVVNLIRMSPIPVVGAIHGLAADAGAQLALTTDLPIAIASAEFQLPGMSIGLPCTSSSTALSRRLGNAFTYRMTALGERVRADRLPAGAVEIVSDEAALETRVSEIAERLVRSPAQAQAMGKWAYWSQAWMQANHSNSFDSDCAAADWATEAMVVHAGNPEAREGIKAFIEKRYPNWHT
ncbi:enoyl-CoA hydratase [Nemania diffusa]|nr:enoyl-CoA hydratase [Nemania diffusa]